jgi:hypothetical protein
MYSYKNGEHPVVLLDNPVWGCVIGKPENVQVHRPDGTIIDCELVHEGIDDQGMDRWVIAGVDFNMGEDHLTIGVMPARTSIGFRAPLPP